MTASEIGEVFADPDVEFEDLAERVFRHQVSASPVYGRFAAGHRWTSWENVPFLPVEAFKWDGIVASRDPQVVFESSGTGGTSSRHPVLETAVYERAIVANFEAVFGPGPFCFVAHLPTYASRGSSSSLIYMVDALMARFGSSGSAFAEEEADFARALDAASGAESPLVVFGTAFGLLDIVDRQVRPLPSNALVIETGGMKTYRQEITRRELHHRLAEGFRLERDRIRSEYGMCELLSQCYTSGEEVFSTPPWVRFKVVDLEDPERRAEPGHPGLLAIFDLANVHSVSPILTSDVAIERPGGFGIMGRAAAAEVRGCNFLMESSP